jgi:hypothetical protein
VPRHHPRANRPRPHPPTEHRTRRTRSPHRHHHPSTSLRRSNPRTPRQRTTTARSPDPATTRKPGAEMSRPFGLQPDDLTRVYLADERLSEDIDLIVATPRNDPRDQAGLGTSAPAWPVPTAPLNDESVGYSPNMALPTARSNHDAPLSAHRNRVASTTRRPDPTQRHSRPSTTSRTRNLDINHPERSPMTDPESVRRRFPAPPSRDTLRHCLRLGKSPGLKQALSTLAMHRSRVNKKTATGIEKPHE